ncbi:MAG TPA: hypothetical protein VJ787_08470 [Thermoleophilia bacterium]|nr:hypothetical protein [Thermoleophilia bacterium]
MKGIAITPHAGGESSSPTYAPSSLRGRVPAANPPSSLRGRVLAFTLFAIIALLLTGGLAQRASAADRGTIVKVGGDVNIPRSDSASAVIVVGGDVTVAGTIRDGLVNVGGDVRLLPTAVVGSNVNAGDTSLYLVGSSLTRAPGATVQGKTTTVSGSWAGDIWRTGVVDPVVRPFRTGSLIGWFGSTVLYALVALLIVALAQRQTVAIAERIRRRFWPTFGWGLLGAVVIVPVVTVLLIISIIGILALLPWALVVFATFLFGAVGAAVLVGDFVLPYLSYRRENVLLAAVVGVLAVRLVSLVPVAGAIAVAVLWTIGFGATFMAFWDWRREKRDLMRGEETRQAPPAAAA